MPLFPDSRLICCWSGMGRLPALAAALALIAASVAASAYGLAMWGLA